MRARGKEYLSGLSEADLFGRTSSRGWMSHLLMYAQELVYQRVDASILRAIEGMNDVPTASAIPRKLEENGLPYSFNAVQKRINENIELWCAYYTKKGLTEDQALSLAVERQRGSPALKESIERRLEHLSVFLEALAILQFRGLLFKNAPWLLELSYYPAVIAHAQAFTGKPIESDWFDIRDVAINGEGGIHYADQSVPCAVLLSAVHRLKSADLLGRVFSELGRVLMLSGRLALTFPADYELHELFYEQVARAGFSQVESGERETSASLGLATTGSSARSAEDQRRLARKVSGKSTVVLLEKTAPSEPTNGLLVEPLIKGESVGAGDSMQHPQYEAIDVPTEVTNGLYHTYSARLPAAVADNALLVTVVDDKDGNSVDLFGYDMNPHERDTIEHGCYDRHGGLSAMDADSLKEAILRRVREGTSAPNPLHIHPLRDTRVSARLVRSVLPTKI
ncbi:TPA: hypothetical protein HA316_01370 [Candidatus Micrarchaeota archaeon]|nr:hypothetical protein [Candidatus Micrarchaeota archaeon]